MNNIILVGNPNTGKTTLFNTLTGSNEKASNWHGVTVGVRDKECKFLKDMKVNDLPGMYSIDGYSNEEKIASKFLKSHSKDLIVNICDANNLKRNLLLSKELLLAGYNLVIVVNMTNENNCYNYKTISKVLGVDIIPIDARSKKGIKELVNYLKIYDKIKTQKVYNLTKIKSKNINIDEILLKSSIDSNNIGYKINDKIDKILLYKPIFIISFFVILFLIFYITFGPIGDLFSLIIGNIFTFIFDILRKIINCINITYIIKSFIFDGIFVGVESVLSFIPQILLLMMFLNILEDTGYMSRVAFMFNSVLKKFGLTGKSLFSLMLGFGCTTSAVITTRNLENINLRKRTVLLLPFMSCSAKLPVFLVISSLFFDKYKYFFVFGLYIFAVLISLVFSIIYKKLIPENQDIFILEMPKYRFPNIKKIVKDSFSVIIDFLVKIGTLILFFSSIVWILQNFTLDFKFLSGQNFDNSILYFLSNKLLFLFKPIGITSAGVVAVLLLGIVAKEMIIVGLAMINSVHAGIAELHLSLIDASSICNFTPISSIVFLVFILIYSPCVSALATVKNEIGKKYAIYIFLFQFLLSFVISFLVYKILTDSRFVIAIVMFLILDILLMIVLRLKKKKACWGNCNACRKIQC